MRKYAQVQSSLNSSSVLATICKHVVWWFPPNIMLHAEACLVWCPSLLPHWMVQARCIFEPKNLLAWPGSGGICDVCVPWISCFVLQLLHVTARYSTLQSLQHLYRNLQIFGGSFCTKEVTGTLPCSKVSQLAWHQVLQGMRNDRSASRLQIWGTKKLKQTQSTWSHVKVHAGPWRCMKANEGTWSTWKINKMESTKETGESCATTSLNSVHCRLREAAEALEENSLVSCTSLCAFTKRVDKLLLAIALVKCPTTMIRRKKSLGNCTIWKKNWGYWGIPVCYVACMNPAESPLQRVKSGHLRFALAKAPVEENLPKSKDSKRIAWFF